MKPLKRWVTGIAINLVIAVLFYLWQFKSIDGAGNALMFYLWAATCIQFIGSFKMNKEVAEKNPRPLLYTQFQWTTSLVLVLALAWIGYMGIAACYLISLICVEAARQIELKPKDAKQ